MEENGLSTWIIQLVMDLECYAEVLAAGSAHSGSTCPASYTNHTQQQQFCPKTIEILQNDLKNKKRLVLVCIR
jgi:hypothetical protein